MVMNKITSAFKGLKERLVVGGFWPMRQRTPPPCVWFPHQNPPTTRHSFMYIMLPCLAPCVTVIMCLSFFLPTRDLYPFSAHFWLFLCFIPAVPLLVVIATEEDYRRVVETFGYYFSLWVASVDTKKDQVWPLLAIHRPLQKCTQH